MADVIEEHTDRERKAAYMRAYRSTPEYRVKKREWHRQWKKSPAGKECIKRYHAKSYQAHPVVKLSDEERKARDKASWLRSLSKPEIMEKRKLTQWKLHIKTTYGLTADQFEEMAVNGCQICGAQGSQKRRLHVDHCHATGVVRGVLCDPCNRGLGFFQDSQERMQRAIAYLKGN